MSFRVEASPDEIRALNRAPAPPTYVVRDPPRDSEPVVPVGYHARLHIYDDLHNEENASSVEARQALEKWFSSRLSVRTMVESGIAEACSVPDWIARTERWKKIEAERLDLIAQRDAALEGKRLADANACDLEHALGVALGKLGIAEAALARLKTVPADPREVVLVNALNPRMDDRRRIGFPVIT